jgi:membrane-associated phospholipid phosphatase
LRTIFKKIFHDNRYFIIPFLIWCIVGLWLLLTFSAKELFFSVNGHYSVWGDYFNSALSMYGRGDSILFLLILLLLIPSFRNRNYIFTALLFGLLNPSSVNISKKYFSTARPLGEYNESIIHTVKWLTNLYYHSFPSGHTIGAFGFFALVSFYLPKHLKPWSSLFFTLGLGTAYSRLYLGQHFFIDVYVGSIIGTSLSWIAFAVGQKYFNQKLAT